MRTPKWLMIGVAAGVLGSAGTLQHLAAGFETPGGTGGGGGRAVTAAKVTGPGETAFFRAVLADLGAPATPANLASLAAWTTHEWPAWPPKAANNPLDTTLAAPGATAFNTFRAANGAVLHVWSYPTATEGATETARTIGAGNFPGITAALAAGRGVCGGQYGAEFGAWSGGGYSAVC